MADNKKKKKHPALSDQDNESLAEWERRLGSDKEPPDDDLAGDTDFEARVRRTADPDAVRESDTAKYAERWKSERDGLTVVEGMGAPDYKHPGKSPAAADAPDGDDWQPIDPATRVNKDYMAPSASLQDRVKSATTTKPKGPAKPDADAPPPPDENPYEDKSTNDTVDDDDLQRELLDARSLYSRAKDQLERREGIEAVANALGKVGAGMYGLKSGSDMSGVKFDTKDWDKKRAAEQGDFNTSLNDISDRRRQQTQNRQFGESMSQRDREFGVTSKQAGEAATETKRHNKVSEDNQRLSTIYGFKAAVLAADGKKEKDDDAQSLKRQGAVKKAKTEIQKILIDPKMDEDMKMVTIQGVLVNDMGVDEARAQKIVVDEGFFSDDLNDGDAILGALNEINSYESVSRTLVTITKDGKTQQVTPADAAKLEKFKWQIVK